MNLLFGVPRLRGPDRLKAELQTRSRIDRFQGFNARILRGILSLRERVRVRENRGANTQKAENRNNLKICPFVKPTKQCAKARAGIAGRPVRPNEQD